MCTATKRTGTRPTTPARIEAVIPVDFAIPGCPIDRDEFVACVKALLLGKKPPIPDYPLCVECKLKENTCLYHEGQGLPGTGHPRRLRAPSAPPTGNSCEACRGFISNPNDSSMRHVLAKHGLTRRGYHHSMYTMFTTYQVRRKLMKKEADSDEMNKRIDVHHVTRVEGHGNIVVEIVDGELKECRFDVVETPRFFEAMLRGRPYAEASHITSRICGICATGHATASLRASENALGVELSEQTQLLRKLTFHGEILDSHILHVYMLVAPDFLGVGSVIPLATSHPDVVLRALRMKKLAGDICAAVAGRHTHPIAMTVGGFTHFPKRKRARSSCASAW